MHENGLESGRSERVIAPGLSNPNSAPFGVDIPYVCPMGSTLGGRN